MENQITEVGKTVSNIKVILAFLFGIIVAIFAAGIIYEKVRTDVAVKLSEFEQLKGEVKAIKTLGFVSATDLQKAISSERVALFEMASSNIESAVVGGAQGWNLAVTCSQGQYLAGVQFEGANQGVKYCVTCFMRMKAICRSFPSP